MRAVLVFLAGALLVVACGAGSDDGKRSPAVQAAADAGLDIVSEFQAPGGLTAYAARGQSGERLILYVTPDGGQVIVGNMIDADGNNLTRQQIDQHLPRPGGEDAWERLDKADWVAEGPEDAERVIYSFTDPNCPYCNKLWQLTRRYHGSGLQVRHILVATLKPSSMGKAAAILEADDAPAALDRHARNFREGGIAPLDSPAAETVGKVQSNNQLMRELGVRGTPAVFYRSEAGEVEQANGVPSESRLAEIVQLPEADG